MLQSKGGTIRIFAVPGGNFARKKKSAKPEVRTKPVHFRLEKVGIVDTSDNFR